MTGRDSIETRQERIQNQGIENTMGATVAGSRFQGPQAMWYLYFKEHIDTVVS